MLAELRHTWPQPGTKTSRSAIISLADLHTHAWWTGVRVTSDSGGPIRVQLRTKEGVALPTSCDWKQGNREWHPLPWPIPAGMAKAMGIFLQVEAVAPFVITCCYHDMPANDTYLFVNGRTVLHHWNGRQRTWGNRQYGDPPMWRTIHRVVPPMSVILDREVCEDDVFCIHDWSEELPEPKK